MRRLRRFQERQDFGGRLGAQVDQRQQNVAQLGAAGVGQRGPQVRRRLLAVIGQHRLQHRQPRQLPLQPLEIADVVIEGFAHLRGAAQKAQHLGGDPDDQRVDSLGPVVPQVFQHLAQAGLDDHLRLHAEAQPLDGPVQDAQGGAAQRRLGVAQVAGETQKADRLGGEEVAQRQVARQLGAAQQVRQALLAVERAQAVGQVDPVPGLFQDVVAEPAVELAFEDAAGVVGADLGQGADVDDVVHAGPQAGLDRGQLAALQEFAQLRLGGLQHRLVQLAALEQVDVLTGDGREFLAEGAAARGVPAEQERGGQRHRHQD